MFLLILISAIFTVDGANEEKLIWKPVPVNVKDVYTEINKEYDVAWDDSLAREALKLAENPVAIKARLPPSLADKFVKGKKYFNNNIGLTMEQKVKKSLETNIGGRQDEFKRFQTGTRFGCNGVFTTTQDNNDIVSSVCLYKRP